MKLKRLITVLISVLLLCLAAVPAAAEGELYIDTKTVYDGMTCSYSEGRKGLHPENTVTKETRS